MLLIYCPYCGEDRPEPEFRHAGEAYISRPPAGTDPEASIGQAVYLRTNNRGIVHERWRHLHGCGRFFNAARHSVSDRFLAFTKSGDPKPDLDDEVDLTPDPLAAGATSAREGANAIKADASPPETDHTEGRESGR